MSIRGRYFSSSKRGQFRNMGVRGFGLDRKPNGFGRERPQGRFGGDKNWRYSDGRKLHFDDGRHIREYSPPNQGVGSTLRKSKWEDTSQRTQGGFGRDRNRRFSGTGRPNFGDSTPIRVDSPQNQLEWDDTSQIQFSEDIYTSHGNITDRQSYEVEAYCSELQECVRGTETSEPIESFEEGNFPDYIVDEIRRSGFAAPTSIQDQGWPVEEKLHQVKTKHLSGAQRRKLLREQKIMNGKEWVPKRIWRELKGIEPKTPKNVWSLGEEGKQVPSTSKTGTKRVPEESFTSNSGGISIQKKPRKETGMQACSTEASTFRMAVIQQGYPLVSITPQQEKLVQMALFHMIGEDAPKFKRVYLDKGALIFVCEGAETVNWLKEMVPRVSPWEEAKLLVKTAAELIRTAKVSIWVTELLKDLPPKDLLDKVRMQNSKVSTDNWRVLNRKVTADGQTLVLEVGEDSLEAMRAQDLKLFLGFSQVAVKVLKDIKGHNGSEFVGRSATAQ